jgi:hypothetical protein
MRAPVPSPTGPGQCNGWRGGGAETITWLTWPLMATAWAAEAIASPDRSTRTAPPSAWEPGPR